MSAEEYFDMEMKTKQGIDKTMLMLKFMSVIESEGAKIKRNYNRFKSYLCQQLQRGITPQEEKNLLEGIGKYLHSEGGERERLEAMDYLFELKFLKD